MEKWTGRFDSSNYPAGFCSGILEVHLNPSEKVYTAPYKSTYCGIYRAGQMVEGKADIDHDEVIIEMPLNQRLRLIVKERGDDIIKGTYSSYNPSDSGTFELHKGEHSVQSGGCIIL